ncbi:MAG TPA: response regulator transcription factor [Bacteroidota bacterium]|nr:response regulator transcription factor [Bacteroidota bacterium]
MKKIRLLLIEDNRLLREGISALINGYEDVRVVATLSASENVLEKIRSVKPDVMLIDLGLRSHNSLQLVQTTKTGSHVTKVIAMDLIPTQEDVLEFVRAGVDGFILKDATIEDFVKTIRSVAKGIKVLPPILTESLFTQIVAHALKGSNGSASKVLESVRMTRRERQVIELISDGMSNKEIAQKLNLSTFTVKSHVHNVLEKLALHTRVQIAGYAHASGTFKDLANASTLLTE